MHDICNTLLDLDHMKYFHPWNPLLKNGIINVHYVYPNKYTLSGQILPYCYTIWWQCICACTSYVHVLPIYVRVHAHVHAHAHEHAHACACMCNYATRHNTNSCTWPVISLWYIPTSWSYPQLYLIVDSLCCLPGLGGWVAVGGLLEILWSVWLTWPTLKWEIGAWFRYGWEWFS